LLSNCNKDWSELRLRFGFGALREKKYFRLLLLSGDLCQLSEIFGTIQYQEEEGSVERKQAKIMGQYQVIEA